MEHAVAFMAGASYLILGPSMAFRWRDWSVWLKRLRETGRPAGLTMGMLHLAIGTFILAFHWQWTGMPMLLSLLGAKAVAEGFVYSLFPGVMVAMLKWLEPHHRLVLPLAGIICIGLAVVFLCEWQKAAFPDYNGYPFVWLQQF